LQQDQPVGQAIDGDFLIRLHLGRQELQHAFAQPHPIDQPRIQVIDKENDQVRLAGRELGDVTEGIWRRWRTRGGTFSGQEQTFACCIEIRYLNRLAIDNNMELVHVKAGNGMPRLVYHAHRNQDQGGGSTNRKLTLFDFCWYEQARENKDAYERRKRGTKRDAH